MCGGGKEREKKETTEHSVYMCSYVAASRYKIQDTRYI